jgi:putative ABC transport system substrate-binding protein
VRRVALLLHPDNPAHAMATRDISTASHSLGTQLQVLKARDPKEIWAAFGVMARECPGAVLVMTDAVFTQHRAVLRDLAAKSRLPLMYGQRLYPEAGGLMSYGVDLRASFRQSATYVDKILKGAKPADLPVEQPTKFELVINMKTAKALGLTIPQTPLLRADQVIE